MATADSYHPYPPPLATYNEVVSSPQLFMDTLKKLHVSMGTKFMIPIVGGKDLDLYRLFVEVTSRGGISKVIKDRKWKEVTSVFSFPSSATNASFILRKYYVSLLYHYEQIYLFKAKFWTPLSTDALQNVSTITAPPHGLAENLVRPQNQEAPPQPAVNTTSSLPEVPLAVPPYIPVSGVIDGKFDGGYLVTVKFGSENLKGVLYQVPQPEGQHHSGPTNNKDSSCIKPEAPRRHRRKKSEMKRKDPERPKTNRSGYNFFFAEQHARLKPLHPGKDREISKMIGELWNNLKEPERSVYQEKAVRDKERYKQEMEDYNKRQRTGLLIKNVEPVEQFPAMSEACLVDRGKGILIEGETSAQTGSDKSNFEGFDKVDEDVEIAASFLAEMPTKNVDPNKEVCGSHMGRDGNEQINAKDAVEIEANNPENEQIVNDAVPMVQFPPMTDAGLMVPDMNVQVEGEESCADEAEKDLVMGGSAFQPEIELNDVNVEKEMSSSIRAKNTDTVVEDERSIPVQQGEVDPSEGHESR